jgi:GNAT superfamily N-acetyltransferase
MNIRPMSHEDLPRVQELAKELGYSLKFGDLKNRYNALQEKMDHGLFVATDEEKLVGWLHVNIGPTSLLNGERVEIVALVVDESYRSGGIGKKLMEKAEGWSRSKNISTVFVRSNVKRDRAHAFYQREGYVLKKTSHAFVKELP